MEHSDLCEDVEWQQRCADCIDDYIDGKQALEADIYHEENEA
jgi:hypothetical protein